MKITKILLIIFSSTFAVSCGDQLAELNLDPNQSTSGGDGPEVFVAAQAEYAVSLEAYYNETNALLAQYWAGGPGVALNDAERFFFTPADFNNEWSFANLQALSDLKYVKDNGTPGLAAVSEVMTALIYQNLVDHYGDIPYSEAMRGAPEDGGILTPKYDDAKTIYDDLIVRLNAAIAVLSNADGTLNAADLAVGDEDLIYGGDLDQWIKLANSLKLRLLMRQSITDASVGPAVIALISSGTFITSEDDMAVIPFQGAAGLNQNPQYLRRESGVGQFFVASESSTDQLSFLNDPRASVIYDEAEATGTIVGLAQGGVNEIQGVKPADFSFPSAVAYGESNDVILMSHWEVMFLRAEADMRFGTADDETTMYNAAVTAHFNYIGATGAVAYLTDKAAYDASASTQTKSNLIGVQKWISMNGLQESEGWIEARRFDVAGNNIFTNTATGIFTTPVRSVFPVGQFPSIRLYPQTEISFNPNTPKGRTLFDKVFWDN
ncbi:MAG TPA: SusD/RagB family nutrient-binding outer membrane lipoprotein [Ohtaekwangia sp.]